MAFFEAVPVVPILVYGGLVIGMGGAMIGVLLWSGRFENQRPGLERWARRIGYTGLVLLVIGAGLIVVDLVLDMFEP